MNRVTLISILTLCFFLALAHDTSYATTNVALNATVTLHGAPFFENGWGGGLIVSENTVVDGIFLPRHHQWDQGPVWWDSHDGQERYITLDLGGVFRIESLVVQADDNDAYILSYWNMDDGMWRAAWDVPNYDIYPDPSNWGMQTRPNPSDNTERYYLAAPIVTNALRFEGNLDDSDKLFSVSEIQAYGKLTATIEIKPETLNLKSKGKFTVFLNLPYDNDEEDIDVSTVECESAPALKGMIADDGRLIIKFGREDLVGVPTGDAVKLTVTGNLMDGTLFEGSDTITVIGDQ